MAKPDGGAASKKSLHQWYAGKAVNGVMNAAAIAAQMGAGASSPIEIAEQANLIADAMIAEFNSRAKDDGHG